MTIRIEIQEKLTKPTRFGNTIITHHMEHNVNEDTIVKTKGLNGVILECCKISNKYIYDRINQTNLIKVKEFFVTFRKYVSNKILYNYQYSPTYIEK